MTINVYNKIIKPNYNYYYLRDSSLDDSGTIGGIQFDNVDDLETRMNLSYAVCDDLTQSTAGVLCLFIFSVHFMTIM